MVHSCQTQLGTCRYGNASPLCQQNRGVSVALWILFAAAAGGSSRVVPVRERIRNPSLEQAHARNSKRRRSSAMPALCECVSRNPVGAGSGEGAEEGISTGQEPLRGSRLPIHSCSDTVHRLFARFVEAVRC